MYMCALPVSGNLSLTVSVRNYKASRQHQITLQENFVEELPFNDWKQKAAMFPCVSQRAESLAQLFLSGLPQPILHRRDNPCGCWVFGSCGAVCFTAGMDKGEAQCCTLM